jgi:hypothetical protein
VNRLSQILSHRKLKRSLCQAPKLGHDGKPLIDFVKWANGDERGPYLVLIYVPKTVYGPDGLDTFMGWYNAKEWLATQTRDEDDPECLIFKDEVHQIPSLAAKAFEQIVETRKYRVGQNWAFHSWAQVKKINPHLYEVLAANNPNICLLKSDESTYKMLANILQPFTLMEDLLPMENHWSVNRWRVNEKDETFMCKLIGPPPKVKDRTYLWDLHSRIYGRPKEEVDVDVARREIQMFQLSGTVPGSTKKETKQSTQPVKSDDDALLPKAIQTVMDANQASIGLLQRKLHIGYARAARLIESMEKDGIIGPYQENQPRQVLRQT